MVCHQLMIRQKECLAAIFVSSIVDMIFFVNYLLLIILVISPSMMWMYLGLALVKWSHSL
jgi:hypothetical protein